MSGPRRRGGGRNWLEVVARVNRHLIGTFGEDGVTTALEILGSACEVDRASLFEVVGGGGSGVRLVSQRYEWSRGGVGAQVDNPDLQEMPADDIFPGWLDRLEAGEPVFGLTRDFPESVRTILEPQGIVSILLVPIHLGGTLWGTLGFDECAAERPWDRGEVDVLTAVAGAFGAAVVRYRAEREVQNLQQRIDLLVKATGTSIDIIDGEYNLRFVDSEWRSIYGEPRGRKCYEYFFGDSAPHEGCGAARAIAERRVIRTKQTLPRERGRVIDVISIPFQGDAGEWLAAEINIDVTDKVAARESLDDHRAFQSVLAAVRGVGIEESDETVILALLESAVEEYGFRMAWYGQLRERAINPLLWAGVADRYLEGLRLEIRDPGHPDADCAMSRAILSGRPFGYGDLASDEGFRRWRDYALELGYSSNLALPVEVEAAVEGGIMVYAPTPGAFPEGRVKRLALLSRELGSLLSERRRLRRARERERVQRELGIALAADLEIGEALKTCLEAALASSGLDAGGVYLEEESTRTFRLLCWKGLSDAFVDSVRTVPPGSPSHEIIRRGECIYAEVADGESEFTRAMRREGIRSLAAVPVAHGGRTLACLNLASRTLETIPLEIRNALETIAFQMGPPIVRIRAREDLGRSEQLYRTTVDALEEWVHVCDRDLRILLANRAFLEANERLGLSPSMVGRTIPEVYPFLAPDVPAQYRQVFETGRPLHTKERVLIGTLEHISETRKIPVLADGEVMRVLTVINEVTERERERELRDRMQEQVQRAQKFESLGVMAGGVAHDFNNLLTGIVGNTELALAELPVGSRVRERVQRVRAAALRASELTRKMLDFAGKGRRSVGRLDLNATVEEMAGLAEAAIPKRVRIAFRFGEHLPPAEADPTQIRQVVMNLILNAAEAIGKEAGTIVVSTSALDFAKEDLAGGLLAADLAPGRYLVLAVEDSGCGMTQETVGRIFEPFFTTKFTGRGLGLAAVAGIVRGHGGTIRVESRPGEGSRFQVLLPSCGGTAEEGRDAEPPAGTPQGAGLVLVVEEDDVVQELVRETLRDLGFEVELFATGAAFLERLSGGGEPPDALVLDLDVSDADALDLLRAARDQRGDLPAILCGGYSVAERAAGWAVVGPARFLMKPFGMEPLAEAVRALLKTGDGSDP